MEESKKGKITQYILILLIACAMLILAVYNIAYIKNVNGIIKCYGASILSGSLESEAQYILNVILYLLFISVITIPYLALVFDKKTVKSEENGTKKSVVGTIIAIAIISILAGIILPNNSTDVYYYMGVGRMDAKYGINMYENNFLSYQENFKEDEIISNSPGIKHKFIYGPLWSLMCKFIGNLPTDSTLITLYIFKLFNILVHIINCYLIYRITKSKRAVIMYGLNPLVLFEGIINCHNDIYLVTFMLLAIYLKQKNKLWVAVLSIAIATLIKYTPIIILPFILGKFEIKKYLEYGIEYIAVFLGVTVLLTGSITSIFNVIDQTGRYANSLYLQLIVNGVKMNIVDKIAIVGKVVFLIYCIIQIIIRKKEKAKDYMWILMLFLLLAITNYRNWYIIWLFALIPVLEDKDKNRVIALSVIATLANFIMYYFGESYIYGGNIGLITISSFALYNIVSTVLSKYKKVKLEEEKNGKSITD